MRLLRAMDLPLPCPEGPHTRIGGNLFAWSSDELWATDFIHDPDGPGWRLDRLRFDEDLRAAAVSAGATFRPARVRDIAREDDGWRLRLDDGATESARWVIDATGRRAALARRLGARRWRDAGQIALYALGSPAAELRLSRTVIEAVPRGCGTRRGCLPVRCSPACTCARARPRASSPTPMRGAGRLPRRGTSDRCWPRPCSTDRCACWRPAGPASTASAATDGSPAAMPPCRSIPFPVKAYSRRCMAA